MYVSRFLLLFLGFGLAAPGWSQNIDSIYFHLYTDSLKKGQHNYINVDGKLSNGRWQPLSDKEILFSSSDGKFSGNELIIPASFKPEKIIVKAVLKSNPAIWKEVTIWIKKLPDPVLPTRDEIINNPDRKKRRAKS